MVRIVLWVGTGGFIGSVLRYYISLALQSKFSSSFPYGTLGVNIAGCLLIGLLFGLTDRGNLGPDWRLFLVTGLCGGFTTFSAFSLHTFNMLRDGEYLYGLLYVGSSLLFGVMAILLGIIITRINA